MILSWAETAWEDYLFYWHATDKKVLKRINLLITDIEQHPFSGLSDPEPLRHNWTGYWSRRIDREHRILYKSSDDAIIIELFGLYNRHACNFIPFLRADSL